MARRRFSTNRVARKTGNLVWITTIIEASILEIAGFDIGDLVIPTDWGGDSGFDRCTLMGIRGWLGHVQQATGTATDVSALYLAIYVAGDSNAGAMAPGVATDYTAYDVLWTGGGITTATASSAQGNVIGEQLEVKARRRLTSAQQVRISAGLSSDTGTPRWKINGVLRCLVKTE